MSRKNPQSCLAVLRSGRGAHLHRHIGPKLLNEAQCLAPLDLVTLRPNAEI
jgi:hypothetical protein